VNLRSKQEEKQKGEGYLPYSPAVKNYGNKANEQDGERSGEMDRPEKRGRRKGRGYQTS
jgi:hypothetical protein